jgi:glycosyltransferase involved in cell wall biosynthesis
MKILIVNNMAPFVWGGAEELAVHLQRNLIHAGHEAEVLRIPFQWEPASRIPTQMLMVRGFELNNVDRVIALKFPAYLIRHPQKTFWLLHQYRQAYDLYDANQSNLPAGEAGQELRRLIRQADDESLREARRIFTNSEVTRQRLQRYNGFDAEVLLPPLNDPERFNAAASEGYIFAGGRINELKRQHLLLEALALSPPQVRLVIGGPPDTPADAQRLKQMAETLGVADRVKLDLRFLPREDYARYINHAAAVAYLPFDEDSLGYVTMEAASAGKALISTFDSGGVTALARNGETGWVAEPRADALAQAMIQAYANARRTAELGAAAKELWDRMDISWPRTVERLLA